MVSFTSESLVAGILKSQNPLFFQLKTYFSQFIGKFLKFKMKCLSHHVKFEMRPVFRKFPILFATVELKSGHSFSQFINRTKIWVLEFGLRLHFQAFPNSQRDGKL